MTKTATLPLTLKTLETNAQMWLRGFKYRESGTVVQVQPDCEIYLPMVYKDPVMLERELGPFYQKYLLAHIPLENQPLIAKLTEGVESLLISRKLLKKRGETLQKMLEVVEKKGYELGLFVSHAGNLLTPDGQKELSELEHVLRSNRVFSVLFFTEIDITDEKYTDLVSKCSSLFTNVIKYPLYSREDADQFITYNAGTWGIEIDKSQRKVILDNCGGQLWFVRHLVRNLRNNPAAPVENALNDELLIRKVEAFYQKFTEDEKKIISHVVRGGLTDSEKNTRAYRYLKEIKLITETFSGVELTVPVLRLALQRDQQLSGFRVADNTIYFDNKNLDYLFTPKEQGIFKALINQREKIVSREELARIMWGDAWEDQYSDWALDQGLHRLRVTLEKNGFNKRLIRTIKCKGARFG